MNQEILSYIVAGGILIGGGVPLVALLIHTIKQNRKLDEAKREKKQTINPLKEEEIHNLI